MDSGWTPIGPSLPFVSRFVSTACAGFLKLARAAFLAWARWFWRLNAGRKLIALVGHAIVVVLLCTQLIPGRAGIELANGIVLALAFFAIAGLLVVGSATRGRR